MTTSRQERAWESLVRRDDPVRRALLDHGEPCPDGCCPYLPDVEAAYMLNDQVLADMSGCPRYSECEECQRQMHEMFQATPLRVVLQDFASVA